MTGAITLIPTGNKSYAVYEGWHEEKDIRAGITSEIFANVYLDKNNDEEIRLTDNNIFEIWKKAENCLSYKDAAEQSDIQVTSLINITLLKILVRGLKDMYKNISLYKACNFITMDKMKCICPVAFKFDPNEKDDCGLTKHGEEIKKFEYENVDFELDKFGKHAIRENFSLISEYERISAMPEQNNKINLWLKDIGLFINDDIKQYALDKINTVKTTSWKTASKCKKDIRDQIKNIKDNGGRVDTILMSANTYSRFQSICGRAYHYMIITDYDIPDGEVYIYDQSIMTVGNGSILFRSYSNSNLTENITEIWKWTEPKIHETLAKTQAVKLVGV